MSANIEGMLNEAQRELDAGRKDEAMTMLIRVTELDERNERAWLLLAQAVDTEEEKRTCLDNVLIINPDNEQARQILDELDRGVGTEILGGDDPFGMMEEAFDAADFGGSSRNAAEASPSFESAPASTGDRFGIDDVEDVAPPPPVSRAPIEDSGSLLGDIYEDEAVGESHDYGYGEDEPVEDYDIYGSEGFEDEFEDDYEDDEEDFLGMIPDDVRPTRAPGIDEKPNTGLFVGIGVLGVLNLLAIVALVLQLVG
jgi:hypothetical protein